MGCFLQGLNRLGKIAADEYGICLTYHHHMGTVVQDEDEVERMMEETGALILNPFSGCWKKTDMKGIWW